MTSDHVGPPPTPAYGVSPSTQRTPLYGPEFAADPDRVYAELRRRHGPIAPVDLAPDVPAMLVIGYETALEILRDPGNFPKDPRRWQATVPEDCPVLPMMGYRANTVCTDGETHARLRGAVTDSMSRVDLNKLRTDVENIADSLIDRFGPTGEADLISEYSRALPLRVLSLLFGCPPALGDRMVAAMMGIYEMVDPEKANAALIGTMMELVALKRGRPGTDVASWLAAHPARLSDEEMVSELIALMGAGAEPEMTFIAGGLRLLLSDDKFAGDVSGGSVPIEDALDHVLWTDPPMANLGVTYPLRDMEVDGVRLPEAQPVVISFAAANTDPSITSEQRMGNRAHLAWSAGPHTCPAQGPARLIASAAIEKILDRVPDMELAVPADQLIWRPSPFQHALTELPVRFTPLPASSWRGTASPEPLQDSGRVPAAGGPVAPAAPADVTGPAATPYTEATEGTGNRRPRRWLDALRLRWRGR